MVKLAAPCLSLGASGSIGGAITFSTWKGRAYARELVKPANPQSAMQVSMRAMMKFLSQNWAGMTAAQKADWATRATAGVYSNFNAYTAYNQARWRNFTSPSKMDPATGTGTGQATSAWAASGGVRMITLSWTVDTANDGWGMIIHRHTAGGQDDDLDTVVAVVFGEDAGAHTYIDSPLAIGSYWYGFRPFTDDGMMSGTAGVTGPTTVT